MEKETPEINRNELAIEIMKVFLNNQGRYRRMTLLSRIIYYLGGNDWKADFCYNYDNIAKNSFIMADAMLKESAN